MKILFLTHSYPNYVPDLLLHGLRKLLGPDVVDFPRKDCLYHGVLGLGVCPPNHLCPGWFPADCGDIDREDIAAKIGKGFFDCIIADWRVVVQQKLDLDDPLPRLVIIDGEDSPVSIPPGRYLVCRRETDGSDFSIPLPMALPEEIFNWITRYDDLPKKYSIGFLGSTHDGKRRELVEKLASLYPDSLFSASRVPSENNPFPEGRFGRDEYYQELQKCRLVLSLPGAGYDTFRFWENAACNAIHLAQRFPLFIPNGFKDNHSIVRFTSVDQLRRSIDRIACETGYSKELIINGRLNLTRYHLTISRARYLIDRIHQAYNA
jgi:hypothetical protein